MTSKVRSARGQVVDFDLLQIKRQMASNPKPINVKNREEFIDRKNRRRAKKTTIPIESTIEGVVPFEEETATEITAIEEKNVDDLDTEVDNDAVKKPQPRKIKKSS